MFMILWRLGAYLLSFSTAVYALQLDQPHAAALKHQFNINGWVPVPNKKPEHVIELFGRQEQDLNLCGHVEGKKGGSMACGKSSNCLRSCRRSGTSLSNCNPCTSDVESRSVSACPATSGSSHSLAQRCPPSLSPYCGYLQKNVSGEKYRPCEYARSPPASSQSLPTSMAGRSSQRGSSSSSGRASTSSSSSRRTSRSSSTCVDGIGATRGTSIPTQRPFATDRGISSTSKRPIVNSSVLVQKGIDGAPQPRAQHSERAGAPSSTQSRAMGPEKSAECVTWAAKAILGLLTLLL